MHDFFPNGLKQKEVNQMVKRATVKNRFHKTRMGPRSQFALFITEVSVGFPFNKKSLPVWQRSSVCSHVTGVFQLYFLVR